MGVVYLAEDGKRQAIALKVIKEELAEDEGFRARFKQEIAAAKRVDGAFTASVIESDLTSHPAFLATEFIDGPTLDEFVSTTGPLEGETLSAFAVALAEALAAIHRAGLVHRDLKPSNILLSSEGPKVIDFGIARAIDATSLTGTGISVGTPAWMAPEQARGGRVDERADIFSWASIVVYASTARSPFGEGPSDALLYRIVHEEPLLTGLDQALAPLVTQALSKEPEARPTAHSIVSSLVGDATLDGSAKSLAVTASQYLADTWALGNDSVVRRKSFFRRWPALALFVAVLLVGLTGAWLAIRDSESGSDSGGDDRPADSTQRPETAPIANPPPDARDVPIRQLLGRGTKAMDVLYANLNGSDPEEIVLASSNNKDDPFAPKYVDVFQWDGEGWRKELNLEKFVSPGAGSPLLDPELSGVDIGFLEAVDFYGDSSEELVVGIQHFGAGNGPLNVSVLQARSSGFKEMFFAQTERGGRLRQRGNSVILTTGAYTPADPLCCPSFMSSEKIGVRNGLIKIISRHEAPIDTGDSLTDESRLRIDGISSITVGMTLDEASRAAGVPIEITFDTGRGCNYAAPVGGPEGLSFMVEDGRISRFDVHGGLIRTLSGIGLGSSKSLVTETYPGQIEERTNIYGGTILEFVPTDDPDLLMAFYIDRSGVSQMVSGRAQSVRYVEGCV